MTKTNLFLVSIFKNILRLTVTAGVVAGAALLSLHYYGDILWGLLAMVILFILYEAAVEVHAHTNEKLARALRIFNAYRSGVL